MYTFLRFTSKRFEYFSIPLVKTHRIYTHRYVNARLSLPLLLWGCRKLPCEANIVFLRHCRGSRRKGEEYPILASVTIVNSVPSKAQARSLSFTVSHAYVYVPYSTIYVFYVPKVYLESGVRPVFDDRSHDRRVTLSCMSRLPSSSNSPSLSRPTIHRHCSLCFAPFKPKSIGVCADLISTLGESLAPPQSYSISQET